MLQKMKRVQVIGPKKEFNQIVDLLYREGTLHLEDVSGSVAAEEIPLARVKPEKTEDVTEVLGKISSILATLPKVGEDPELQERIRISLREKTTRQIIARAEEMIRELESTTRHLASRKSELTLSITAMTRHEKVLNIIQPVERELPSLEGFEVTILLIQKDYEDVIGLIKKELEIITQNKFEMIARPVDSDTFAAIMVFNKRYSERIHAFIYSVNVNEVRLPGEYMGKPFYEIFALIEENKIRAQEELKTSDEQLATLSSTWDQELSVMKKTLVDIRDETSAFSNFGLSEFTFVIMGWVPAKKLASLKRAISTGFSDRVIVNELKTTSEDMESAPIFYDNPRWVKPFEFIMKLVSPPKYMEIDPSPVLAIFFPIFFGLMVGDIGYGIVILVFALILKWRLRKMDFVRNLSDILIISSIPTIFFGYLFGEFFGNLGEEMGWLHPVTFLGVTWNRLEAIMPLLILAIAIGALHVFLGLIIGIINESTRKNKKHVSEKVGMLLALIGLIAIIALVLEMLPSWALLPTTVMVIIAVLLIIYGAGAMGPMEIMSSVGNILSYARLMAIGLASVILALVANRIGGEIEIVAVGVLIAVLLHALNIVLAMFSPSIHSVRLHLVEFFSKFYEGGGVPYKPFKKEIPDTGPAAQGK